jgi:hypothetical protein
MPEPEHTPEHAALASQAADLAERVLPYFESRHPDDLRPKRAIDAARAWARGEITVGEARDAALGAHDAARETPHSEARAAARAAGHAAATAHGCAARRCGVPLRRNRRAAPPPSADG